MVAMIPFDLVRLDNTLGDGDNRLPVMDRILNIGKVSISSPRVYSMQVTSARLV